VAVRGRKGSWAFFPPPTPLPHPSLSPGRLWGGPRAHPLLRRLYLLRALGVGGTPTQTQTQNNALGPGHTTPHTGAGQGPGVWMLEMELGLVLPGDRVPVGGWGSGRGAAEGSVVRCWAQN